MGKGTYALAKPLATLDALIKASDLSAARAYLTMLQTTFAQPIPYTRCRRHVTDLPRAVLQMPAKRRRFQTLQLARVAKVDDRLIGAYLEGLERGLTYLDAGGLEQFVNQSLEIHRRSHNHGSLYLSLSSYPARELCAALQVSVPFDQMQARLDRYLEARTGGVCQVRSLATLSASGHSAGETAGACTDGRYIYLPPEIDYFDGHEANERLYLSLTGLECSLLEFGSYNFDYQRALDRFGPFDQHLQPQPDHDDHSANDYQRFYDLFPLPTLAADLFCLFDQARIHRHMQKTYPGLNRQLRALLLEAVKPQLVKASGTSRLTFLYAMLALQATHATPCFDGDIDLDFIASLQQQVNRQFDEDDSIEACALLVYQSYFPLVAQLGLREPMAKTEGKACTRLKLPFRKQFAPERYLNAHQRHDRVAKRIATQLRSKGVQCYAVDIREALIAKQGRLTVEDLDQLVSSEPAPKATGGRLQEMAQWPASERHRLIEYLDSSLMDRSYQSVQATTGPSHCAPAARYPEWDDALQDYLSNHTAVHHRVWPVGGDDLFYRETMGLHRGLIASMRRAFEMLRPEGLTRLRRWVDGDEFDYRSLIDHRIDKRAGRTPSDRVYTKALKKVRDVAVLLLVDMSRSTSQTVGGTGKTVLDVEKEAVVLFCEALAVVGDRFAVAGFSGNGPLQVDYFAMKGFNERYDRSVHRRISTMTPQRNTRLGAAVRHATAQMANLAARIRIIILLSDGFPNDLDYKKRYAIRDTRKALAEAHAVGIHTHALTINIAPDSRLDSLYGNFHHNLITDVRDLPAKLLRVYSALTRN
jgi:hypothetical protein